MLERKEEIIVTEGNFLENIKFRFVPYWPLFAILLSLFLLLSFFYLRLKVPVYEVTATLVINDQQKGVGEGQSVRALNVFAANKIVENEVQVLQSRTLLNDVVNNLRLYAPVFEESTIRPQSAYNSAPVVVEVQHPERLIKQEKIGFSYNAAGRSVQLGNKNYPLNQWLSFPFATIRFVPNPNHIGSAANPLFFSLVPARLAAEDVAGRLQVNAASKLSSVINIGFTDPVPERGKAIVNELLAVYNRASQAYNMQLAASTLAFVDNRLSDVTRELDSIEARIQQFKSQRGVVDLSEQGRIYLQNVADNDRRATEISMQLAVLDQVARYVRSGRRTGVIPTTLGIDDPVLSDLLQRLNQLELQYANLRTTVPENNSLVLSIESELEKIRPNILNIVQNQRARLNASRGNLTSASGRYSSMLREIPQQERALLEISRQQAIKNDVYAFLLQRREEAALSNAATFSDSRIVDRAEASINPVGSGRLIALVGAFVAALALSMLFVFLKEGMNNKVLFRAYLEKHVAFPVVGEIVNRRSSSKTRQSLAPDVVQAKQFNQMLAALGLFDVSSQNKRFLVTSFLPKEGKTFISNHFAASLAATGKRVLLVDLNIYDRRTSGLHLANDEAGFTNYIKGSADVQSIIRSTDFPNLDLLPAGNGPGRSLELLLNPKTEELFGQLAARYDYLVVDSPPIELAPDAFALAKFCDVTLFPVRHGVTPKSALLKFEDGSVAQVFPKIGIVYNGVRPRGFLHRYFGYGYGYGYEKVFRRSRYLNSDV